MKGYLRQWRKYYQEKYTNFLRNLKGQKQDKLDNDFKNNPLWLIDGSQQLNKDQFERFTEIELGSSFKISDMTFYLGNILIARTL